MTPDLISILSYSTDSLLPPNTGLWFVDSFRLIVCTTPHCIVSILQLSTHLSDSDNWLAYCHIPLISCQMAGLYSICPQPLTCFRITTVNSSQQCCRFPVFTGIPVFAVFLQKFSVFLLSIQFAQFSWTFWWLVCQDRTIIKQARYPWWKFSWQVQKFRFFL